MSYEPSIMNFLQIFPTDLQSVRCTLALFLEQAFAQSKSLLTFAARK